MEDRFLSFHNPYSGFPSGHGDDIVLSSPVKSYGDDIVISDLIYLECWACLARVFAMISFAG